MVSAAEDRLARLLSDLEESKREKLTADLAGLDSADRERILTGFFADFDDGAANDERLAPAANKPQPTPMSDEDWEAQVRGQERLRAILEDIANASGAGRYLLAADMIADLTQRVARVRIPTANDNAPKYTRAPQLVARLMARARLKFTPVSIGQVEITRLPPGGVIMLTAAPGAGKTSFACGIAIEHARERGPVVFGSLEMDADELGARMVGEQCDASWEDGLTGRVPERDVARALDLPRLSILDGDSVTLAALEAEVAALRAENPDQPVLVVIDYLQIWPGEERDVRARVAAAAQAVRRFAKRLGVVVLAISQPSRAAGRALSSGELIGADSMTAMAESSEIERAAYVTMALGSTGPLREDGTAAVSLSIGKGRFGGGDHVWPMTFNGRTGRMRTDGDPRPASEVKAELQGKKTDAKSKTAALAIEGLLAKAREPMSASAIRTETGINRDVVFAALKHLRDEGRVVRVRGKKSGGAWPLWTPDNAKEHGLAVVPEGIDG